jgi:hypothetical protein
MKKTGFLLGVLAFFSSLSFIACSDKDSDGGGAEVVNGKVDDGTFTRASLTGVVHSSNGGVLKDATVTNGTQTTTTDANGVFSFDKVNMVKGRAVLKITKTGYIDIVRTTTDADGEFLDIVMISEQSGSTTSQTFSSGTTATMNVYDQAGSGTAMKVELPAGYKNASTGETYTGQVNANMVYLDPDSKDFSASMPGGDLAAVRLDGSEAQLVSYGMVKVELTGKNGEKLQLADGDEATVTFSIPTTLAGNTPAIIPLWSFNETTGLWEEEGEATLQGDVYIGKVKHFSWWNLDYPYSRAELKVTVKDTKGKVLPYVTVDVDGQRTLCTKTDGTATCYVPSSTQMTVTVHPEAYGNYSPQVKETVDPLEAGTVKELTITLPAMRTISGKATNKSSNNKIVSVYIEYDNQYTEKVISDIFGKYNIVAPFNYKGKAKIYARNAEGKTLSKSIEIANDDLVVNFEFESTTDTKGSGTISVLNSTGDDVTFYLDEISAGLTDGVSINDSILTLCIYKADKDPENFNMEMLTLTINNYDKSVSKYTNVPFNYMIEGNETGYTGIWSEEAEVTVTVSGDMYTFKIAKSPCNCGGSNFNYDEEYTLKAEIVAPLSIKSHTVQNATQNDNLFPSFMPYISGKSFKAMIIDKCSYAGKGGCAYYQDPTLTKDDYDKLVTTAKKTFGDPVHTDVPDPEQPWYGNIYSSYFFKDKKLLFIQYDPDYVPSSEQYYHGHEQQTAFEEDGVITVVAVENFTADYTVLFDDSQYARIRNKARIRERK